MGIGNEDNIANFHSRFCHRKAPYAAKTLNLILRPVHFRVLKSSCRYLNIQTLLQPGGQEGCPVAIQPQKLSTATTLASYEAFPRVRRWCSEQGLGVKDFCPVRRLEGKVAKAIEAVGQCLSRND